MQDESKGILYDPLHLYLNYLFIYFCLPQCLKFSSIEDSVHVFIFKITTEAFITQHKSTHSTSDLRV